MATEDAGSASKRRRRIALATGVVAVIGLMVAIDLKTDFGERTVQAVTGQVSGADQNPSRLVDLLNRAHQAMVQKHPDVAIIYLKNAVSSAPSNGGAHLELGRALLSAGDAVSAERELRSARHYGVTDASVLPILYTAMLTRSESQQLLAQFPAPAEGDESALASQTLRARASAFEQTGDRESAAASLDRALLFDRSVDNLVARAQLAQRMGDPNLAIKVIGEALSKAPDSASALLTNVNLLIQTNQRDKALAAANDFVKHYPKSPQALLTRAGIYLRLRDNAKALIDINASLEAAPNFALGVYFKALAMEQAKDFKGAWNLAQSLPPAFVNSNAEIGLAVSQMAFDAGHKEIGTSILSAAVINFPNSVETRVRLAAHYLELKDAPRALQTLLPMQDSSDPQIMVLLAQTYDMEGQYAKSIEYLEKANAIGNGSDLLERQIAVANLRAGNLDAAIADLEKLNAAAPGNLQTAGALIYTLLQKNALAQALDVANKLTAASPKNPFGPLFQGQILMRRGDLDGAVSAFSRAIALNAKFAPAIYDRSIALAERGDFEPANADLRAILAVDPSNLMAKIQSAQIAVKSGQTDKAVALLRQAAAEHPKDVLPVLVLANYDMQHGRMDDAAALVANFLKAVPDNSRALALQGQIQLATRKLSQALTTFQQVAKANPQSAQSKLLLATALVANGDTKDAIGAFQDAVKLAPAMQAARDGLIQLAIANKNEPMALSAARDFASQQPGPASAETLARTYITLNRNDDAVNVLRDSQAKYPNAATLVTLTTLLRKQGDAKRVDAMLTDWVAKHPDDLAVRLSYAQGQMMSNPAAAEEQYRIVLKSQPYNLTALNNMGWLLQQKNPKQALPYAEKAAKVAPDSSAVLDTLAWTKWQLNDKGTALSLLERAHQGDSKNAEVTYHLAITLDGTGRHSEAKKMLSELLASGQDFTDKNAAQLLQAQWR